MIMSGQREARIEAIQAIDIHGTLLYDITYSHHGEPGQLRKARVGQESIYTGAKAGDSVRVSYLMNVATQFERA